MKAILNTLPPPPIGRTGWPWTVESVPLSPLMPDGVSWPKISIVTPSYNQGQYIEETIRSILLQGYPNYEYIIIDGGSTDNTVDIIRKYEPWLTYWVSKPDSGQSDAINEGIKKCTGEIFNWICSDDYLEPQAFENIASKFVNKNINVVIADSRALYRDGTQSYGRTLLTGSVEKMVYTCHIAQPGTFFRMTTIKTLGLLNCNLHFCMDAEWWAKYLLRYSTDNICVIQAVVVNVRYHVASKSISQSQLFGNDLDKIKYSVLKLFNAPRFMLKFYSSGIPDDSNSDLVDRYSIHESIHRKRLLSFYLRKSIKDSFLSADLVCFFLNLGYGFYLMRFGFLRYLASFLADRFINKKELSSR